MKKNELILSVRDLNIKFNLRGKILHAIRGIDLDVYHGEVLAIVGESGSGKSVFTKSFMGLLDSNGSITSGTIDYFGADDHQPIRLSALKKEKDWLKVRRSASSSIPTSFRAVCASVSSSPSPWPATPRF